MNNPSRKSFFINGIAGILPTIFSTSRVPGGGWCSVPIFPVHPMNELQRRFTAKQMKHRIFALSTALFIFLVGCSVATQPDSTGVSSPLSLDDIPSYSGDPYIPVNGNAPDFSDADLSTDAFEYYSDLDQLVLPRHRLCQYLHRHDANRKRSNIGVSSQAAGRLSNTTG